MSQGMVVDVHVFGSRSGYSVLAASPGVSERESAALDPMACGVAELGPSAEDVAKAPALLVRTVPGGRIAMTRWFPGEADDSGRPTLELRTMLFSPDDWGRSGRNALRHLAGDHAIWRDKAFADGEVITLTPPEQPGPMSGDGARLLADLVGPGDGLRLIDSDSMRAALIMLVEYMQPSEASQLQWGLGLSQPGRDLDIMTLTRGGVIATLDHPWNRVDLRDWKSGLLPYLTKRPDATMQMEAEPVEASGLAAAVANAPPWEARRRTRSAAPIIAALCAVVVIAVVLWMTSDRSETDGASGGGEQGSTTVDTDAKDETADAPSEQQSQAPVEGGEQQPDHAPPPQGLPVIVPLPTDEAPPQEAQAHESGASQEGGAEQASPEADAPAQGQPEPSPPLQGEQTEDPKSSEAAGSETPGGEGLAGEGQAGDGQADEGQADEGQADEGQAGDAAASDSSQAGSSQAGEPEAPVLEPGDSDSPGSEPQMDPDATQIDDPVKALKLVESLHARLMAFSPDDLFSDLAKRTQRYNKHIEPDAQVQSLIDTLCERVRDRAHLSEVESLWLEPQFLERYWGPDVTRRWKNSHPVARVNQATKQEVMAEARERAKTIGLYLKALKLAIEIERHLGRSSHIAKATQASRADWFNSHARYCLAPGEAELSPKIWQQWTLGGSRATAKLQDMERQLAKSRKILVDWIEREDGHGTVP
ncbi:MAG: hypothetical protein MK101_04570 [Phycisphaerales bacterium]|nr:hypothetical protein [Phycisphaerales bacterium]